MQEQRRMVHSQGHVLQLTTFCGADLTFQLKPGVNLQNWENSGVQMQISLESISWIKELINHRKDYNKASKTDN